MPASAVRIRPLPDVVINQIAAGEVIERPASVVKELVENSIDAGASHIEVSLEEGGLQAIVVTDDGQGLAAEELPAALRRHWTSKLHDGAGLASIATLGFRGEALASIASVAEVEIVSRQSGSAHAWRITASPGREPSAAVPHPGPPGTRITVRELFYQVPARKRFLKRARTEYLHVLALLRRIGFANPRVALTLSQDGSRGLRLPHGEAGLAARWRALFGAAMLEDAVLVEADAGALRLSGWLGAPAVASNQAEVQFFALNGRPIRDRQLAHAVRLAYGERLASGRFPVYALALDMPLDAADVNVHPGKLEVRFAELREVHDFVHGAVLEALGSHAGAEATFAQRRTTAPVADAPGRYLPAHGTSSGARQAGSGRSLPAPVLVTLGQPLALVDDCHLLLLRDGRVNSLDWRAAWADVLAARLARESGATRPLLVPERMSPATARVLDAQRDALAVLGVEIDDLGAGGLILRALPSVLPALPASALLAHLATFVAASTAPFAALVGAAAAALVLGQDGRANLALFEEFRRAAAASGVAIEPRLVTLRASMLAADEREQGGS